MKKIRADRLSGAQTPVGWASIVIGVSIVTLISGSVGFLYGTQLHRLFSASSQQSSVQVNARPVSAPVKTVVLPSIVTNLSGIEGGWIRVELVVLLEGEGAVGADLTAVLTQDSIALLRTLSFMQISGASGFQHLREELIDRMAIRSGRRVLGVFIQSLVIE